MRRLKTALGVAGLIALLAPAGGARATTVFDNLSQSFSGGDGVTNSLYASFSTGNQPVNLSSVALDLFYYPGASGTVYVTINNDQLGTPGSVFGAIGTVNDSAVGPYTSPTVVTFTTFLSSSTIPLAANTRYWINVFGSGSSAWWAYTSSNSGTGLTGEYDQNASNPNNGITLDTAASTVYLMQINTAADPAPVPEPVSIAILSVGLIGLGLVRRSKAADA